jgi:hypothetical protein
VVNIVTAAICSGDCRFRFPHDVNTFWNFVLRKCYLDCQVKEFEVAGPCYLLLEYDDDSVQIYFLDLKGKGHEKDRWKDIIKVDYNCIG